jgi:hypothetical protein
MFAAFRVAFQNALTILFAQFYWYHDHMNLHFPGLKIETWGTHSVLIDISKSCSHGTRILRMSH